MCSANLRFRQKPLLYETPGGPRTGSLGPHYQVTLLGLNMCTVKDTSNKGVTAIHIVIRNSSEK